MGEIEGGSLGCEGGGRGGGEGVRTGVDEPLAVCGDVRLFRDGLLEVSDGLVGRYCDLQLELARAWVAC